MSWFRFLAEPQSAGRDNTDGVARKIVFISPQRKNTSSQEFTNTNQETQGNLSRIAGAVEIRGLTAEAEEESSTVKTNQKNTHITS